jgi:hypothetical protein
VVRVSADDLGVDLDVLRDRETSRPKPTTPREFRCEECGARCTRLTDGQSEAGHRTSCSRRLRRLGGGQRSAPSGGDGR